MSVGALRPRRSVTPSSGDAALRERCAHCPAVRRLSEARSVRAPGRYDPHRPGSGWSAPARKVSSSASPSGLHTGTGELAPPPFSLTTPPHSLPFSFKPGSRGGVRGFARARRHIGSVGGREASGLESAEAEEKVRDPSVGIRVAADPLPLRCPLASPSPATAAARIRWACCSVPTRRAEGVACPMSRP